MAYPRVIMNPAAVPPILRWYPVSEESAHIRLVGVADVAVAPMFSLRDVPSQPIRKAWMSDTVRDIAVLLHIRLYNADIFRPLYTKTPNIRIAPSRKRA